MVYIAEERVLILQTQICCAVSSDSCINLLHLRQPWVNQLVLPFQVSQQMRPFRVNQQIHQYKLQLLVLLNSSLLSFQLRHLIHLLKPFFQPSYRHPLAQEQYSQQSNHQIVKPFNPPFIQQSSRNGQDQVDLRGQSQHQKALSPQNPLLIPLSQHCIHLRIQVILNLQNLQSRPGQVMLLFSDLPEILV